MPSLIEQLIAGIHLVENDGRAEIRVDPGVADLIDSNPGLLGSDGDEAIARWQEGASPSEIRRLLAARHILDLCREAGSTAPLRAASRDQDKRESDPGRITAIMGFLQVAQTLERSFAEGGLLRAGMAVGRAIALMEIARTPGTDGPTLREAALVALSQGLTVLWQAGASEELANWRRSEARLWSQRPFGDREDNLERVIDCYEQALTGYSREVTPRQWAETQNSLGVAYYDYQRGDRPESLERAVECFEKAIAVFARQEQWLDWAMVQNNLGNAYAERLRGEKADNLERAIACFEMALTIRRPETAPTDWAMTQNNLGTAYLDRLRGERADNIERAIACLDQALTIRTQQINPHQWAETQSNLGTAYLNRARGDKADNLERCIAHFERALTVFTRDTNRYQWATTQNNLGNAYGDRLRGDRADNLERAIACYMRALEVHTQDDHAADWAMTQNNLGITYSDRARGSRADNLKLSIRCFELAAKVYTYETDPHRWAGIHINLGAALRNLLGDERADNIERAIACYEQALKVYTPENASRQWAATQNNLCAAYVDRMRGSRMDNIERAIHCCALALTVYAPETAPHQWAGAQNNLGVAYAERQSGDRKENLEHALVCLDKAQPLLRIFDPPRGLGASVIAGKLLRELGRHEEARRVWREALQLRERLLGAGTSAATRGEAARSSSELAIRLALLEAENGACEAAAETLERGRATALRVALALDDIWLANLPDKLRIAITTARDALERKRATPPAGADGMGPAEVRAWEEEIAAAQDELGRAVAAAQATSGFQPPAPLDAAGLAALAPEGGAVVLLAPGPEGGLACILPHDRKGAHPRVHTLPLPQATQAGVRAMLSDWMTAYERFKDAARQASRQRQPFPMASLLQANAMLEAVLERSWAGMMEPVLTHPLAAEIGLADGTPLLLMPQGHLAMLPLHAAGRVRSNRRRAVIDDHLVSYAPSGAALWAARQRLAAAPAGKRRLFGLFNPKRAAHETLRQTEEIELPALRKMFGAEALIWSGADATAQRALTLNEAAAAYVHFGCHGGFDGRDPERSGLYLAGDDILTVRQIAGGLRLLGNRWVALSACETAMVDVQHLPDEFVGLPAAFLQAGAAGVLATLWLVFDGPTAHLMPEVYRRHLEPEDNASAVTVMAPAAALRDAVQWLRQQPNAALFAGRVGDDSLVVGIPDLASLPIVWAAYSYHGI